MVWPQADFINGVPIVVTGQPKRKTKNAQGIYYEDANGHLIIPDVGSGGGIRRGSNDRGSRPTSIVINNSQWDLDRSPDRRSRRRSSHSTYDSSDSSDRSRTHSRDRRQHRRHSKHYHRGRRSPSPDPNLERRLEKLKELERKEEEEEARRRFEEERILQEARETKRKKQEEELKKQAIEEWKQKELEKELKEKEEKEEADQLYQQRLRADLAAKGYSEESITRFLNNEEKHKRKEIVDLSRPTYIKVHHKHLSPGTLDFFELPWEWDRVRSIF